MWNPSSVGSSSLSDLDEYEKEPLLMWNPSSVGSSSLSDLDEQTLAKSSPRRQ